MIFYNPVNWYWVVPGNSHVWSSAALNWVEATDGTYQAWLASGHHPTNIASVEDLLQVQQTAVLPNVFVSGLAITSSSDPSLNATYALDDISLNRITSLALGITAGRPLPGGGDTFNYPDIGGMPHAFSAAAFLNFASACENYVYDYGQALAANVLGQPTPYPTLPVSIA
jgi:hypothetical protein